MGSQLTYRSNMPTKKRKIRARDCNDEAANCGGLARRLLKYVQRDETIIGQFGELFAQLGVFCSLRQLQELIRLPQKELFENLIKLVVASHFARAASNSGSSGLCRPCPNRTIYRRRHSMEASRPDPAVGRQLNRPD